MYFTKKILLVFTLTFSALFLAGFSNSAQAAVGSQCTGGQTGGAQTGCTHDNDASILDQCKSMYNPDYCTNLDTYLAHMALECAGLNPPPTGVDCAKIYEGGYYGRESAKYAAYVESAATMPDPNGAGGTGGTGAGATAGAISLPTGFGLPDPAGGIKQILASFLTWLLGIVGIVALMAFIISGLQYFLAAGDEKTAETAKRNMTYSIIGVIVALSGFVIIRAIDAALNAGTTNGTVNTTNNTNTNINSGGTVIDGVDVGVPF